MNNINLELYSNTYSLFDYVLKNINTININLLLSNSFILGQYKQLSKTDKEQLNQKYISQNFFNKIQSVLDYKNISFISLDKAYSNISDPKMNDNELNFDLERFSYSQLVIAFYYNYQPYIIEHRTKCKPFNLFQDIFFHKKIFNIFLLINNKYIKEEYLKISVEEKEQLMNYREIEILFNEIQGILNIENF